MSARGTGMYHLVKGRHLLLSWYRSSLSACMFLLYTVDELAPVVREDTGPFRMPISDKYKVNIISCVIVYNAQSCTLYDNYNYPFFLQDMGTVVLGKVEPQEE